MTVSLGFGSRRQAQVQLPFAPVARRRAFLFALAALAFLSIAVFTSGSRADAVPVRPLLSAPVVPFSVERLASLPQKPWLAGHRGLDLDANIGAPVTSPATGVVSYVGFVVDRPVLSIRHDQGLVSSFEPIDSTAVVGDIVARGEAIGTVAEAPHHCARSACLHWGLRLSGEYVDPLDYLEGFGPIRLLPFGSN